MCPADTLKLLSLMSSEQKSSTASHLLNRLTTSQSLTPNEVEELRSLLSYVASSESSDNIRPQIPQSEPHVSQPQYFSGDRKQLPDLL